MKPANHLADHPLNLIAAQYVLGVLSASAREQARRRMLHDADFRDLVYQWERQLNPLASLLPEQAVPAQVWQAIEARLAQAEPTAADAPRASTIVSPTKPTSRPPAANDQRWQWLAGISSAIAACLALVLLLRPDVSPTPSIPPLQVEQPSIIRDLAVLTDSDSIPTWIVRQQDQQLILSSLITPNIPSDRDLELWSIQGDAAPQSLGVIQVRDGQATLVNIATDLISADAVLAISLEPKNGSPTGLPTGAVLFTGKIRS
ncbi:MAG: anti-sigma factor [Pseudomonadota bacterium]|nr:anti-sigma factor [Pseudomonadota bacterium]